MEEKKNVWGLITRIYKYLLFKNAGMGTSISLQSATHEINMYFTFVALDKSSSNLSNAISNPKTS